MLNNADVNNFYAPVIALSNKDLISVEAILSKLPAAQNFLYKFTENFVIKIFFFYIIIFFTLQSVCETVECKDVFLFKYLITFEANTSQSVRCMYFFRHFP